MFGYKFEYPDYQTTNGIYQISKVPIPYTYASKLGSLEPSALMAKLRKHRRMFTSFVD